MGGVGARKKCTDEAGGLGCLRGSQKAPRAEEIMGPSPPAPWPSHPPQGWGAWVLGQPVPRAEESTAAGGPMRGWYIAHGGESQQQWQRRQWEQRRRRRQQQRRQWKQLRRRRQQQRQGTDVKDHPPTEMRVFRAGLVFLSAWVWAIRNGSLSSVVSMA